MSLNSTPTSERVHISFFGLRNAGKSSLVNAVTAQQLSVVSNVKGTTTDPVKKAMELLPIGPVVIIDTPGIDDVGELGELRVKKTKEILTRTDIAVLVTESNKSLSQSEKKLISVFKESDIPYVLALNKSDLTKERRPTDSNEIYVSSVSGENINELKELIGKFTRKSKKEKFILKDLIKQGDKIVLVIPIDESAPKGRLILPQQMTIREILDCNACAVVCKDTELENTLISLKDKPELVITDSQVFDKVSRVIPENIPLTSFSILFARYKGDLRALVKGAVVLSTLKDGDKILISEGCTHHRQCNDIGTVKMPEWIKNFSGSIPEFHFTSGDEFPQELSEYKLVVHCGGCMLNEKQMKSRIDMCVSNNIPIVNYGIAIAHMNSILKRSIEIFPSVSSILD